MENETWKAGTRGSDEIASAFLRIRIRFMSAYRVRFADSLPRNSRIERDLATNPSVNSP